MAEFPDWPSADTGIVMGAGIGELARSAWRLPHGPGAAARLHQAEAAHSGGLGRRTANQRSATGIRGTGSVVDTVASGVHDRTGRPPWQAADRGKRFSASYLAALSRELWESAS